MGEVFGHSKAGEEVMFDFGFFDSFGAVATGLIGRPVGEGGGGL